MDAERWRRIEDLFHSTLECAPAQRASFLDSACASDAGLREEVESLLASYEKGTFAEPRAFADALKLLEENEARSMEGQPIGPYKVIRKIGQGGMGAVYLASRDDQAFRKEVAIKVIKRGQDTEEVIHRFRSERQILASLDHPNITRLLDGGTTPEGLPYFVMEYIQGQPIDQYCDGQRLAVADRLKLFQSVCAAVQYAHQNLVIHRDIKAGNILMTPQGVPRLLDFGIAKIVASGSSNADPTMTLVRRLTPESASPEQVRGGAITTASDVYSLGVLLYKLLTGHSPYRLAGRRPEEIERAICEQHPEKPSVAIGRAGQAAAGDAITSQAVSASRQTTPEKLRRSLEGDLDNIVLMALRKEPDRRYSSVEQLSQDVSRHLGNLPVIARPDTAGYRAAKFVARHKAGVAAAALVVFSLSAGIAAATWQANVAATQRNQARIEAAKAQRINAFLQDMLSYSSPAYTSSNVQKDPEVKVSEVVAQAAQQADVELADQPEVLAQVQRTLGELYYAQGRYDRAEAILRDALAKYRQLYGPDRHETVEASNVLANTLLREGKNPEAESLFRHDIEVERAEARRGRANVLSLAHALGDYGSMLDQRGDSATAPYLQEALVYASQLTGKERAYVAMIYNDLGDVAYRSGDLSGSERFNRAALDEYRKLPEGKYVEMGATLSNLGAVLIKEGKLADAEPFVRKGLELRRKLLGDAHPDTAMSLHRLADLLYQEGDNAGAEHAARESLEVFHRAYARPEESLYFGAPLTELGLILNREGRPREAETYLRQALALRRRLLPSGSQLIGSTEGALGESLSLQKHYGQAEPLLLDSYKLIKSSAGEHDPRTAEALHRLIALYDSWSKPSEAAHFRSAPP